MKYYLISDNRDTLTGMRLAGINGKIVHEPEETKKAIMEAADNPDIGIILVTSALAEAQSNMINDLRLHMKTPLIVTIPDRHSKDGKEMDLVLKYLNESIGIKI